MAMKARYTVVNGEVIAQKRGGVRSLYVPDPLGSTVALLDNTQAQTDTFSYWPYGEVNARTGTTATPFQFVGTAGYYQDSSSRDYVRARTLNTQQGRWMTNYHGRNKMTRNPYVYLLGRQTRLLQPSTRNSKWFDTFRQFVAVGLPSQIACTAANLQISDQRQQMNCTGSFLASCSFITVNCIPINQIPNEQSGTRGCTGINAMLCQEWCGPFGGVQTCCEDWYITDPRDGKPPDEIITMTVCACRGWTHPQQQPTVQDAG